LFIRKMTTDTVLEDALLSAAIGSLAACSACWRSKSDAGIARRRSGTDPEQTSPVRPEHLL